MDPNDPLDPRNVGGRPARLQGDPLPQNHGHPREPDAEPLDRSAPVDQPDNPDARPADFDADGRPRDLDGDGLDANGRPVDPNLTPGRNPTRLDATKPASSLRPAVEAPTSWLATGADGRTWRADRQVQVASTNGKPPFLVLDGKGVRAENIGPQPGLDAAKAAADKWAIGRPG